MISDGVFQAFVQQLATHKKVERGAVNRFDWSGMTVPDDVVRVLTAVGGWRYFDFQFIEPAELESTRTFLTKLVDDFEAGRSQSWEHSHWNPAWYPLAQSSVEVCAYDPVGCFGGAPGQVVRCDFKGGEGWDVYPSASAWLSALTEGFASDEKAKDATSAANEWARAQGLMTLVKLPEGLDAQRSRQRFEAGVGSWTELRHEDGRCWAIRERRDGYELRIGEGEDAVIRKRKCPSPPAEVRKLIREQKAEGFRPVVVGA